MLDYIGFACQYKTLFEFLINYILEFSELEAENEVLQKDIKDMKIKHEKELKLITLLSENNMKKERKQYTDNIQKNFHLKLGTKLKEFNDK